MWEFLGSFNFYAAQSSFEALHSTRPIVFGTIGTVVETEIVISPASEKQLSKGIVKIFFKICLYSNNKQLHVGGSTYLSDLNEYNLASLIRFWQ